MESNTYAPTGLIESQPVTTYFVPNQDLQILIDNIQKNITYLQTHKTYLQPENYHNLNNYHHYILNLLNDIKGIQLPINKYKGPRNNINTGTQFPSQPCPWNSPSCPWETQFDQNIHNPPTYQITPNNIWAKPPWK